MHKFQHEYVGWNVFIPAHSPRAVDAFQIRCAAIIKDFFELELLGHRKQESLKKFLLILCYLAKVEFH